MIRIFVLFLLFVEFLFGKSYFLSPVPLPKTYVLNLDTQPCDISCLEKDLMDEQIFSFLAHANAKKIPETLIQNYRIYAKLFNIHSTLQEKTLRVAMLLPDKVIGNYATSTTKSVLSYLMSQTNDYTLKSFMVEDEKIETLQATLQKMREDNFFYVIAPLTLEGVNSLSHINTEEFTIYVPTVAQDQINTQKSSLYFGGINYAWQLETLLPYAQQQVGLFYDDSLLGVSLNESVKAKLTDKKIVFNYPISRRVSNLKHSLESKNLEDTTLILNTPIIKSSMILSQLTLYENNETNILSSQINYDPIIFTMTQRQDRNNLLIANSIVEHNSRIDELNKLLGNDTIYNWINYSTLIGIDYLYSSFFNSPQEYKLLMKEHQVNYPIEIVKPMRTRFQIYTQENNNTW